MSAHPKATQLTDDFLIFLYMRCYILKVSGLIKSMGNIVGY